MTTPEVAARASLREFELGPGYGTAGYLPYSDRKAAGMLEANMQSATLASPAQLMYRNPTA